jgi:hypothetical protein
MPDAMVYKTINGQGLLFTANEGDSREFGNVTDANRISSSTFNNVLDATAFPDQSILRNNKFLGRLSALKYSGDTDGDGDYDELHVMGGRSYSIWNAQTGSLVYDSKDLIEQITANHPTFGAIFNASNTTGAPASKNRSDDKGPEPEGVAVSTINGSTYAFVSLERIGGVMMFNVDNPNAPVFVGYANNRSTTLSGPDLGAEGIIIIPAADSPNGNTLVILANEVSSTLSIYQVNTCAEVSGAPITSNDLTICPSQSTQLVVTNTANVSYQWLLNGSQIANANGNTFSANQAGNYSVRVSNSTLGCVDTTNIITVTSIAPPSVSAGADQTVCGGVNITLTASGANNYIWNNGANTAVINLQTGTSSSNSTFSVTGTDSITGCSSIDTVQVIVNALPNVDAGSDFTACLNQEITLTATGGISFVWSNNIQNGQNFTLTQSAIYSVTGIDANGCLNSDEISITALNNPTVSAGENQEVCSGDTVILSGSGASNYSWDNGVQNGVPFIVVATEIYTLIGTTIDGCSDTSQVTVSVNNLPIISAGNDESICQGSLVTLTGSGAQSLSWSNGIQDGIAFTPQTTQVYTLSGTDQNGCSNTDDVTVTIVTLPQVNAGSDQTICQGEEITLNGSGAQTFNWDNNVQNGIAFIPTTALTFTLTGTENGCLNTDQVTVTLLPIPQAELGSNVEICDNEIPYSATASSTQAGLTFIWNSGQTGQTINLTNSGLYIVAVTDIFGCSKIDSLQFTVNELPSIELGTDIFVCSNELPAILTAQSSTNNLLYLWSTGQTTQQIQVNQAGSYTVTVINDNGCESNDAVQVQVLSSPNLNAGNDITVCEYDFPVTLNATGNGAQVEWSIGAATPFISVTSPGIYSVTTTAQNGCQATDSVVVTADPCVGIEENVIEFSIFPNPTLDEVLIKTNDYSIENFEILNSIGQIVLTGLLNNQPIFVGDLAKGAYIVRIFNSDKELFKRIVKQ